MKRSPSTVHILVIDDEINIRKSLELMLETEGYRVTLAPDALRGYDVLVQQPVDLVIVDIQMPDISGLQLFERMQKEGIQVPTIVISGNATLTEVARAIQMGAFDFMEKPFFADRVLLTVRRCLEQQELTQALALHSENSRSNFVGESTAIRTILATVEKAARSDASILVRGESGTGKELIARMIHDKSQRAARPFVTVNCAAIPENLIESELFGHERGAFTGAVMGRRGYFEQAHGGTLFLDEVGDLPLLAQAKLLRALQTSEIQKLGSEKLLKVDVRIVAATHKNLEEEIVERRFREDLFYRLNVVTIQTVPLRDHMDDIPTLVLKFIQECCVRNRFRPKTIEPSALLNLQKYSWPGNVRELKNLVERLVILSGDAISSRDLPAYLNEADGNGPQYEGLSLKDFKEQSERDYLVSLLRKCQGNVSKAARVLAVERTHLHKKIQRYKILKREYFT